MEQVVRRSRSRRHRLADPQVGCALVDVEQDLADDRAVPVRRGAQELAQGPETLGDGVRANGPPRDRERPVVVAARQAGPT
jgi:hypothetical protein